MTPEEIAEKVVTKTDAGEILLRAVEPHDGFEGKAVIFAQAPYDPPEAILQRTREIIAWAIRAHMYGTDPADLKVPSTVLQLWAKQDRERNA